MQDRKPQCPITANEDKAIKNNMIYGSVSGKKLTRMEKLWAVQLSVSLGQEQPSLQRKMRLQTTTSKDDGSFSFAKVPYGTWIICEIESPKGYVLSEEEIPVTIGKVDEVVEIELVNYWH